MCVCMREREIDRDRERERERENVGDMLFKFRQLQVFLQDMLIQERICLSVAPFNLIFLKAVCLVVEVTQEYAVNRRK